MLGRGRSGSLPCTYVSTETPRNRQGRQGLTRQSAPVLEAAVSRAVLDALRKGAKGSYTMSGRGHVPSSGVTALLRGSRD
jgi:hypothetical protein